MNQREYLFLRLSAAVLIVCWATLWTPAPARSKLYKYQKDGVWHYTDSPTADTPLDRQEIAVSGSTSPDPPVGGAPLLADYPARNAIEKAAAATVAVKSALGFGSGFFISAAGHIITNKHVVRSVEKQSKEAETRFAKMEQRIADLEKRFEDEGKSLQTYKNRADRLKAAAEEEHHPQRRQTYHEEYQATLHKYTHWRADFDQRLQAFVEEKKTFREGRQDYDYSKSVADLAQSFTIILADNTELYARLLQISPEHDLALLKLDGYRTPCLAPGRTSQLAQSEPVYAIGNPARLQNCVTSGVFSGFQQGFLQTNAQIYPGNSGGPLVTADGQVLGINTFKLLTHKFEGLGFAIPIDIALREFNAHLQ